MKVEVIEKTEADHKHMRVKIDMTELVEPEEKERNTVTETIEERMMMVRLNKTMKTKKKKKKRPLLLKSNTKLLENLLMISNKLTKANLPNKKKEERPKVSKELKFNNLMLLKEKTKEPLTKNNMLIITLLLVQVLTSWASVVLDMKMMSQVAEVAEAAEVAEVEEVEMNRVRVKEDKTQNKHLKKLKKTSQLYEREDLNDLLQKSWLIQLLLQVE